MMNFEVVDRGVGKTLEDRFQWLAHTYPTYGLTDLVP